MVLLKRKRVLAAKFEATIGTAEPLAASDAAFNAFDVEIQPNIEFNERPSQGSFSHLPGTLGPRGGTLNFKTEVFGDGAGGVPGWASTLFPACGWVDSSNTFSPSTTTPGSSVKTLTMAVYEDGLKKVVRGAVGTFKLMLTTGQPAMIEWSFQGVYDAPTDAAILAPTYPTIQPIRFANSTFTVGGSSPGCVESIEIDAGNTIFLRPCPGNVSGYSSALITERRVVGSLNPESRLVATENVFSKWAAGTEEALSIVLNDGTDEITIAVPKLQRTNVQEADRNGIQVDQIEFQANKSADSGDDELTITFDAAS